MIRFCLTHCDKTCMEIRGKRVRTLAGANQGRHFHDSLKAAEEHCKAIAPSMKEVLGWDNIEVRSVVCYDNGDAKGIFFEHEKID